MKGHNESTPLMHHLECMVCEKTHVFDYVYVRYTKFLQLKALCFMLFMISDKKLHEDLHVISNETTPQFDVFYNSTSLRQ
jgi:hypothetical protein